MKSEYKIYEIRKQFDTGTFTNKDIEKMGYNRNIISVMLNRGIIKRESRGVYVFSNVLKDEEYLFQLKYSKSIFCKDSALFLLGYNEKQNSGLYVTFKQGYNTKSLKEEDVLCNWVSEKYYDLGKTQVLTYFGNTLNVYNIERTICDLIRDKNYTKMYISKVIKMYLKTKGCNLEKLYEYAQMFNIEERVKTFVEIVMWYVI